MILVLKEENELNQQYQYGIVRGVKRGRVDRIKTTEIEYQTHNGKTKRKTVRGARDVVVIHRVSEAHGHYAVTVDDKIPCGVYS